MDAGQSFQLVHVYEDSITHAVVPVGEAETADVFSAEWTRRMAALSPAERLKAFSLEPVTPRRGHAGRLDAGYTAAGGGGGLGSEHIHPRRRPTRTALMALDATTRTETDSLGSMEIPADAYWGIHTARALENFPISMRPISVYRDLVNGLAMVKQASARANLEIGVLDAERADLIDRAAQRVIDGEFHDQFVVGDVKGGAGTSTNMNANEVITNIALELAGRPKGDYAYLSPIDHTNRSQSTNDVYPTAVKVGLSLDLMTLLEEFDLLRQSFLAKAVEFHDVLKIGRTQLQDAVPMTLGQEFHGFATTLGYDHQRLTENASLLYEINMGATAIEHRHHDARRLRPGGAAPPPGDHGPRPRDRRRPRRGDERHRLVHVSFLGVAQAQRHQALEDLQ